ncbi:RHS repeat-associated core domain-containing protein [Pseudomonas monteilii]|uniref:RHS repeat-associated core domain-containing protein n=1 Tax=Pseudomonas monteilii TaxID=76759 RepID=UPI0037FDDA75
MHHSLTETAGRQYLTHSRTKSAERVYSPYGFGRPQADSVLGFAGYLSALNGDGYFLGNGVRMYNTQLMRFHSPDSFSPFGRGGINAYAYCEGDPVNQIDPDGHSPVSVVGKVLWAAAWGADTVTSVDAAAKRILHRSIQKMKGRRLPPMNGNRCRGNEALINVGTTVAMGGYNVPDLVMESLTTLGPFKENLINGFTGFGAVTATVGKATRAFRKVKQTNALAKKHNFSRPKLLWEAVKEAYGWNLLRGNESAILEPRDRTIVLQIDEYRVPTGNYIRKGKLNFGSTV